MNIRKLKVMVFCQFSHNIIVLVDASRLFLTHPRQGYLVCPSPHPLKTRNSTRKAGVRESLGAEDTTSSCIMIPPASEADDLDALSLALSILDSGGGENRGGGGVGNGDDDADFPNFDTIDVDVDDDAGVEGFDEFAIDSDGEAEADNFLNLVIDDHPAVQFDVSPLAREVNVGGGRGGDDGTTGMAVAVPNNPTPPSTFSSSSDPHGRMPQMHHVISHPLAVPRAQQEVRPPSIPPSNAATQGRGPIGGTTSIGGGGVAVGGGGGVVGGWTSSLASFAGSLLQQSSSSMHPHPSSSTTSSSC